MDVVMEVDECEANTQDVQDSSDDSEIMPKSDFRTFLSTNKSHSKTRHCENGHDVPQLKKRAVVLLTRLPEFTISALRPPTPQQFYSETESHLSSDSDKQWEPDSDSDSDFDISKKKQKTPKFKKSLLKHTPPPQKTNINSHSSCGNSTSSGSSSNNNNSTNSNSSSSNSNSTNNNNNSVTEGGPIIVSSAFAHSSTETTKVRPDLPEVEVKVGMTVLARRRAMLWQRGKVLEIVTKDDGRVKYKVNFEEKGKSLVSGHHIALDRPPKLEELYVGARVIIQSLDDESSFQPGILSELPSRKNRLRFLIFLDDHSVLYVSLPALHLVCRPLDDTLEDILDNTHKSFMKQYLKNWPFPHLTHYKMGQSINVDVNGVLAKCTVDAVDCSLMQVTFEENGQKDWVHRGSIRLEHMAKFLQMKEKGDAKDNSDPK
ncbi:histone-lysine N-methyltransferase SETDB1-A [Austrofundulus limnaeus]|uniref:Histone-lysine N-methyltransferase SETDB1-A n=1 Tax=Austrofundulus limnaeus TaxID=52670 RepID=A0A2I4AYF4_AUSLI|nr:PREDICTED: histone-lysine N-methyltransferase SETDB1-A-like [Austrofundulus limnaeus]